jgi:hypothetical protein
VRAVKFLLFGYSITSDVMLLQYIQGVWSTTSSQKYNTNFHSGVSVVKEHTELSYQTSDTWVTYIRLTRCWKKGQISQLFFHSLNVRPIRDYGFNRLVRYNLAVRTITGQGSHNFGDGKHKYSLEGIFSLQVSCCTTWAFLFTVICLDWHG